MPIKTSILQNAIITDFLKNVEDHGMVNVTAMGMVSRKRKTPIGFLKTEEGKAALAKRAAELNKPTGEVADCQSRNWWFDQELVRSSYAKWLSPTWTE